MINDNNPIRGWFDFVHRARNKMNTEVAVSRRPGRNNDDHEEKRTALLRALFPALLSARPERPSLRDLAQIAGVQPNTLRHYFGDREGLLIALLEQARRDGERYMAGVSALEELPLAVSLKILLSSVIEGWGEGLGGLHAGSLAEGLGDKKIGPAYVNSILEPTLQSFERLLSAHVARGALPGLDVRAAVLALVSPVLVALLHQHELGGEGCRPLALDHFVEQHLSAWMRGWATAASPP